MKVARSKYRKLLSDVGLSIAWARSVALQNINHGLVKANWEIGRHIVKFEQDGKERAEYGSDLLSKLSKDLKHLYGVGFGRRNVLDMRRFYLAYPKWQTVSAILSWSHYVALLSVSEKRARAFYERQSLLENWTLRELERQINSSLYERLALSRDKKGILKLSAKGHVANDPSDAVKDPYILDFLKIPQSRRLTERNLEQKIIDNLQLFLLELGKGFTFEDIGQMNLYINYFKKEENIIGDNEPVGIILSAEKDEVLVEFALGGLSSKIFISKYQLYLPGKRELQQEMKALLQNQRF